MKTHRFILLVSLMGVVLLLMISSINSKTTAIAKPLFATVPSTSSMFVASENVELVGQIGGIPWAIATVDNYVYIGIGPRLVILDITNPSAPAVIGQSEILPSVIRGLTVMGNTAYIADF